MCTIKSARRDSLMVVYIKQGRSLKFSFYIAHHVYLRVLQAYIDIFHFGREVEILRVQLN